MAQTVKNLPVMQETWVRSLGGEDPLEKGIATHSSVLPGESHAQRSLTGYGPWACMSTTTHTCIEVDSCVPRRIHCSLLLLFSHCLFDFFATPWTIVCQALLSM